MIQDKRKVFYQRQAVQSWAICLLLLQGPGSVETGKDTTGTENKQPLLGLSEASENEEELTRNVTSLIQVNNL